jgi:hypothetical protein
VSHSAPIEVRCELDSLEPISGRVTDLRGRSAAFTGWIEFAAAFAALTQDLTPPSSTAPPEEHPHAGS